MSKRVLIVGATSAVATEVARLYAERGEKLYLIGRNPDKLKSLEESLGSSVAGSESAELTEFDQNENRIERAVDCLGGLDIALIAHGDLGDQLRSENDLDYARATLDINLTSVISLLMPLANVMEQAGHGHLAAITSVAGTRGRPRNYTYGAAKGGLIRYLQGLRSRLYGTGVMVHDIRLGPVDTPMTADHPKNALFGEKVAVARGIVRTLDSNRRVAYLPRVWFPVMTIVRTLPEFVFQRFAFLAGR